MQHFMAGAQRQYLRGSLEHPRCLCCGGMGFTRDRVEMKTQMRLIHWDASLGVWCRAGGTWLGCCSFYLRRLDYEVDSEG